MDKVNEAVRRCKQQIDELQNQIDNGRRGLPPPGVHVDEPLLRRYKAAEREVARHNATSGCRPIKRHSPPIAYPLLYPFVASRCCAGVHSGGARAGGGSRPPILLREEHGCKNHHPRAFRRSDTK